MNCKPGDLAIVVGSYGPGKFLGLIVRCVSWFTDVDGEPRWRLDASLLPPRAVPECDDKWLRPIRGQDGEDEMLRIAGKPSDIKTKEIA